MDANGAARARRAATAGHRRHSRSLRLSPATTARRPLRRGAQPAAFRRLALLALFEGEFRATPPERALERLLTERDADAETADAARRIVAGVVSRLDELDARIAAEAPAIPVSELGRVERTILRSAIWEVLYSAATPSREAINDAVSLARIYAGDAARRLINGVLGSISRASDAGGRA